MSSQSSDPTVIVVVSASVSERPPGLEPLEQRAHVSYVSSEAELSAQLDHADVLLVTDFRTPIVRRAFRPTPRLRWIHATSAGVDKLVFPALANSSVQLTNAAGIFDDAIAEYVVGSVLAFAKDMPGSWALKQNQRWKHRDTERVAGKQMLVVGAGSIGSAIARFARGLGMGVSGVARTAREHPHFDRVVGQDDLRDVLGEADYVALAAPLTAETHHMLGAAEFALFKPSARVINVGRGPLIDTQALVAALQQGQLAGAALDVFEQEPLPADHPLWTLPNVMLSAHMAGDFIGWREALSAQFMENFERFCAGRPLHNRVNKQRYVSQSEPGATS